MPRYDTLKGLQQRSKRRHTESKQEQQARVDAIYIRENRIKAAEYEDRVMYNILRKDVPRKRGCYKKTAKVVLIKKEIDWTKIRKAAIAR